MRKITIEDFARIENDGMGNPRYIVAARLMPVTWRYACPGLKIYRSKRITNHLVLCTYDLPGFVNDVNSMMGV
jgi:hypothetical protein